MANDFFSRWLGKPLEDRRRDGRAKDALAGTDRYDRQDAERIAKEMQDFRLAKDKLCEAVGTGAHLFDDAFFGFYKVDDSLRPTEDMDPHYLLNHRVATEVAKMPERDRLRTWTQTDLVGSAAAAVDLEPDLEVLADRAKTEMSEAERLAQELARLMDQIMQEESDLLDLEQNLDDLLAEIDMDDLDLGDVDLGDLPDPDDLDPNSLPDPDDLTEMGPMGIPGPAQPEQPQADGEGDEGEGAGEEGEDGDEAGQGEGEGPGTGKVGAENEPAGGEPGEGDEPAEGEGEPGESEGEGGQGQGEGGQGKGNPKVDGLKKAIKKAKDKLKGDSEKADKTAKALQEAIDKAARKVVPAIRQGMAKAANNAEASNMAARSWGVEPGQLKKMNASERIRLAERIKRIKHFEELTDMIGKLDRLASAEQMKTTYHSFEEIYDVSVGSDLARILPSELVSLTHPTLKLDFYRKFNDGQLLEYQMRGQEKLGKGGIIFAMDNSGSMSGKPEILAKGCGIATLHIAKEQGRSFYGIHFSGTGQIECFDFRDPKNQDVYRVLDFAEHFYGGGTDFRTPLAKSLQIMQEEFDTQGLTRSDVIFVTDGMAPLDEQFLRKFEEERQRLDFTVYGCIIGGPATSQPLARFCNGNVVTIQDLVSGDDLRNIFRNL